MPPDPRSAASPSRRRPAHRRHRRPSPWLRVVVVMGITTRKTADARLQRMDRRPGGARRSRVAPPDTSGKKPTLDLPGRLEAYTQAQIYARVSGYLKEWKVDIGTPVKAGQLLAEIDAPDLDQQILQAQADLASAQANATLADATLQRGQSADPVGRGVQAGSRPEDRPMPPTRQGLVQLGAGQSRPPAGAGKIQAHHRAVRRPRHRARHRRRRADQRRRRRRPGAVRGVGYQQAARSMSTCRRTTCRASGSAPRRRSSVPEYPGRKFPATVEASAQSVDVASGTTRMQLVVDNAGRRADDRRLRQCAASSCRIPKSRSTCRRAR